MAEYKAPQPSKALWSEQLQALMGSSDAIPSSPKTSVCQGWLWGTCKLSAIACPYAHGIMHLSSEKRFKRTSYCKAWLRGHCRYGDRCHRAHGSPPTDFSHKDGLAERPQRWDDLHSSEDSNSNPPVVDTGSVSKTLMAAAVSKALRRIAVAGGTLADFTGMLCEDLQVTREELKIHRVMISECLLKSCPKYGSSSDVVHQLMQSTMKVRTKSQHQQQAKMRETISAHEKLVESLRSQHKAEIEKLQEAAQKAAAQHAAELAKAVQISGVGQQLQAASQAKWQGGDLEWELEPAASFGATQAPMRLTRKEGHRKDAGQTHKDIGSLQWIHQIAQLELATHIPSYISSLPCIPESDEWWAYGIKGES